MLNRGRREIARKVEPFSETPPDSISEPRAGKFDRDCVLRSVQARHIFLSERWLYFAGLRYKSVRVRRRPPHSASLCSPSPMSTAIEVSSPSTDVFEFHSQHGALPYVPDDVTVVQFFLDCYHPNRPSCHPPLISSPSSSPNPRPDVGLGGDGRKWIVDDESGRGFTHDQVREGREALRETLPNSGRVGSGACLWARKRDQVALEYRRRRRW